MWDTNIVIRDNQDVVSPCIKGLRPTQSQTQIQLAVPNLQPTTHPQPKTCNMNTIMVKIAILALCIMAGNRASPISAYIGETATSASYPWSLLKDKPAHLDQYVIHRSVRAAGHNPLAKYEFNYEPEVDTVLDGHLTELRNQQPRE